MADRCEKCANTRWLVSAASWEADKLVGKWRPFSRDAWSLAGSLAIGCALKVGAVKACSCNPDKLAPWAKSWRNASSTEPVPATGEVFP